MIGMNEEDYLPDEVLQDIDTESDIGNQEDVLELDFEDPVVSRQGVDELLGDSEMADDIFTIA